MQALEHVESGTNRAELDSDIYVPSPGGQGKERGSFLANKDNPCRCVKGCPACGSVLSLDSTPAPLSGMRKCVEEAFEVIRRHVVAVAVYPDCIVEGLNVFEDQRLCMVKIDDLESVQPFTFDE